MLLTVTSSLCACLMETQTCVCVHVCVHSASAVHIRGDSHRGQGVAKSRPVTYSLTFFFFLLIGSFLVHGRALSLFVHSWVCVHIFPTMMIVFVLWFYLLALTH